MKKAYREMSAAVFLGLVLCLGACGRTQEPGPVPTQEPEELPEVVISEVMTSNKATVTDGEGRFLPWVELYNPGGEAADLGGCQLSFKGGSQSLQGIMLEPGERTVVFCEELSRKAEAVNMVSGRGTKIDSLLFPVLASDRSAFRNSEGLAETTERPSPGYENTQAGYEAYAFSRTAPGPLVINEAMVYNEWYLPMDGEYYDWVELKNISGSSVRLGDYYLADSGKNSRSRLPDVTLGPGELYVVLCTDDMGFALNAQEDRLFLTDADGTLLDYVLLRGLRLGDSYGRMEGQNGGFYFDSPTPWQENTGGARSIADKPRLLGEDGQFDNVKSVKAELAGEGEIHYTTDGSLPTKNSELYTAPLELKTTTVLRAINIVDGKLASECLDLSFIINEGHTLPVVSLVLDPEDLSGTSGIYSKPLENWEKLGAVMFYEDGNSFRLSCGVKIHGATSRIAQAKKSFKLNFRSRYDGDLNYDLFENGVSSFSSILLRADQEERYSTMMRDNIMHQLAIESFPALPAQDYRSAVLYLNGNYWGIYNIREAHSEEHYARHYGYDADSVSHWKERWDRNSDFEEIYQFALSHNLAKDENYEYVASRLNIDSVIAWCIIQNYSGNLDFNSPNMRFYYSTEDGKLTYALVDLDMGMYEYNGFSKLFYFGYDYNNLVSQLIKNYQFRMRFVELLSEALNGPMSTENVLALIDRLEEELAPEIPRECKRWGNNVASWERMVERLREYLKNYAVAKSMVRSVKSSFSLTDEEVEYYFGNVA